MNNNTFTLPNWKESWEENVSKVIPARFQDSIYEHVPNNIQKIFENMRETRKGMFIHGEVGTGKTHIAYALLRNAPKVGVRCRLINTIELFKDMREDIRRSEYDKKYPTETAMEYKGILILDDLGVEKATDFVVESLYLIINKRYNEMRPIIFTSNFNLNKLADRVGDRIPSRIFEMCEMVELKGEDKRLKK
ncbi:MAG TPA: cell division protein ZapE [Candidatus Kaiserbacteria bacterium]|nr:cell division protein ZapE [Candidatus Kaiserbacteria bacterium]